MGDVVVGISLTSKPAIAVLENGRAMVHLESINVGVAPEKPHGAGRNFQVLDYRPVRFSVALDSILTQYAPKYLAIKVAPYVFGNSGGPPREFWGAMKCAVATSAFLIQESLDMEILFLTHTEVCRFASISKEFKDGRRSISDKEMLGYQEIWAGRDLHASEAWAIGTARLCAHGRIWA